MKKQMVGLSVGMMLIFTSFIPITIATIVKKTNINTVQINDVLDVDVWARGGGVAISFSNIGTDEVTNLSWKMNIRHALILNRGGLQGSIFNISPGEIVEVDTGPIIGLAVPLFALITGGNNGNITMNYDYDDGRQCWQIFVFIVVILALTIYVNSRKH